MAFVVDSDPPIKIGGFKMIDALNYFQQFRT
jgi:hypothetical protein